MTLAPRWDENICKLNCTHIFVELVYTAESALAFPIVNTLMYVDGHLLWI